MRRREPALLYTVGASACVVAQLREDLGDAGLFMYDHFDESAHLRDASVLKRPEFARAMVDAILATGGSSEEGDRTGPHVLVVDQIDDLGPNDLERTAVVGALRQMGCEIRAGGALLPDRWYRDHVRQLDFRVVDALMQK